MDMRGEGSLLPSLRPRIFFVVHMKISSRLGLGWVFCVAMVLVGCGPKTYETRGVVKELKDDGKAAVIQHEKIPGYMEAMTMSFDVRDTNELSRVHVGDTVSFRMLVTEKDGWIDRVRVLSNAPPESIAQADTNAAPIMNIVPNVPPLDVGDLVPDYTYTNELGRVIRLSEFRGKALAITFIFTRCPFPTFCPRMTDHFKTVQKALQADVTAPKNWHLLSLSFDPAFDTPATLRAYGKARGNDPERWNFATGDMTQVASLAQHFGLYFSRTSLPSAQNHNLRTAVIDPSGRVHKVHIGNDWTPEELTADIVEAAKKVSR